MMFNEYSSIKFFKNEMGITLVEALVTVTIFTVLMGVSLGLLLAGSRSWEANKTRIEMGQKIRIAADRIKDDLTQTGSGNISGMVSYGTPFNTITINKITGVDVSGNIILSGNIAYTRATNPDRLLRNGVVVVENISSLTFVRQSATPDIVTVSLAAQKSSSQGGTIARSYSFNVQMRN